MNHLEERCLAVGRSICKVRLQSVNQLIDRPMREGVGGCRALTLGFNAVPRRNVLHVWNQ